MAQLETPGLALMRQQRDGNEEKARPAPLVTMGTSLVSHRQFSGDKAEGRKAGQMDSVTEIYPSHEEGK